MLKLIGGDFWSHIDQMKNAGLPHGQAEKLAICVATHVENKGRSTAVVSTDEFDAIHRNTRGGVVLNKIPFKLVLEEGDFHRMNLYPLNLPEVT